MLFTDVHFTYTGVFESSVKMNCDDPISLILRLCLMAFFMARGKNQTFSLPSPLFFYVRSNPFVPSLAAFPGRTLSINLQFFFRKNLVCHLY
jgi:hypothetical protein